jgi:hypothetical protein
MFGLASVTPEFMVCAEIGEELIEYFYIQLSFDFFPKKNSYLFNEFVCNLGFFWHGWASLKLE